MNNELRHLLKGPCFVYNVTYQKLPEGDSQVSIYAEHPLTFSYLFDGEDMMRHKHLSN